MDKLFTQDPSLKRLTDEMAAHRNRRVADTDREVPDLEQRTPWFAGCVAPHHVGAYEVTTLNGVLGWCWWSGHNWGDCWGTLEVCLQQRDRVPDVGRFHWPMQWRGVLQ